MSKVKRGGKIGFSWNVIIESIDKYTGKVIKREKICNTIVNTGKERIAKLLGKLSAAGFDYLALGTDATAVQVTDTSLGTEVEREQATVEYVADYKCKFTKVFSVGSGVSYSIKEVGVFDGAIESGSIMWARLNCNNTLDSDTDLSVILTYNYSA